MLRLIGTVFSFSLFTSALAAAEGDLKHPDWHPDGNQLILEGSCSGSIDVYTLDLSSGVLAKVLDMGETEGYPRWFRDGKRVAFHQMSADRSTSKLFIADLHEGEGLTNISKVSDGKFDVEPTPSPNGNWLAYSATLADGKAIAFLSLENMEITKIFQNGAHVDFPTWILGEQAVVFYSNISGEAQLYKLDVTTSETWQLTTAPGPNFTGEIDHGGTKLVYASQRDDDREIYLLDLETGEDVRLTNRPGRDGYPKFSPNGAKVAFHSRLEGEEETRIVVMDLETRYEEVFDCSLFE